MKRIFIIHRWEGTPKTDWYPWLKIQLEKKGFKVFVPEMTETAQPEINSWVKQIKQEVKNLDEETYLVGHSIGCQAIMRFLEKENYKGKIGGIVFVAGWFKLDNLEDEEVKEIARPWTNLPIDFSKIKSKTSKFTVFLSTNEPYGFVKENSQIFKDKLGAKVVLEKNKGHFTQDDGAKEMPNVLNEILEFSNN